MNTGTYYKMMGLLDEGVDISDEETNINKLMYMALDRLVSLPHFYAMGRFRNDAGSGAVTKDQLNCHYWRLVLEKVPSEGS